jgi:hypothetical protein
MDDARLVRSYFLETYRPLSFTPEVKILIDRFNQSLSTDDEKIRIKELSTDKEMQESLRYYLFVQMEKVWKLTWELTKEYNRDYSRIMEFNRLVLPHINP